MGKEEIPCILPYNGTIPADIVAYDEKDPPDCNMLGLHGFCYDKVLMSKLNNWELVVKRAQKYLCAFGPNFSVPMDARRCEAIEAIRLNRIATINLQLSGVPTIQTVSLTNPKFFDIAFLGLAPNCPVAFENMCANRHPHIQEILRHNVYELMKQKNPTMLIVIGNRLPFENALTIPVTYYKSRLQKLKDRDYDRQA